MKQTVKYKPYEFGKKSKNLVEELFDAVAIARGYKTPRGQIVRRSLFIEIIEYYQTHYSDLIQEGLALSRNQISLIIGGKKGVISLATFTFGEILLKLASETPDFKFPHSNKNNLSPSEYLFGGDVSILRRINLVIEDGLENHRDLSNYDVESIRSLMQRSREFDSKFADILSSILL